MVIDLSMLGLCGLSNLGYGDTSDSFTNSIAVEIRPHCVAIALGGQSSENGCAFSDTRISLLDDKVREGGRERERYREREGEI